MSTADVKYTKDHEWIKLGGASAEVGITDFAQRQLGDVVFLELPEVGRQLTQGEAFGTIESVKAVSELFSPMAGEVVEINSSVRDTPEEVNSNPTTAWLIKLKVSNPAEASELLTAEEYADFLKQEQEG